MHQSTASSKWWYSPQLRWFGKRSYWFPQGTHVFICSINKIEETKPVVVAATHSLLAYYDMTTQIKMKKVYICHC